MLARLAMPRHSSSIFSLPGAASFSSSSGLRSKWSSMIVWFRLRMMRMSVMPERTASSTRYWMAGLSTMGSIPLGMALVAGRTRVPRPAAGMTAFLTACIRDLLRMLLWLLDHQPHDGVHIGAQEQAEHGPGHHHQGADADDGGPADPALGPEDCLPLGLFGEFG